MKREKAAVLLVGQGLAGTADEAARLIMGGHVFLDRGGGTYVPVAKPGDMVSAGERLAVRGLSPYVSRGAYKLLSAIEHFCLDVAGRVCLDAGASTGGFTDCLLQRGAARVYAVDVGRCQLHEKLRQDPRVVSLEGVNLRCAPPGLLPEMVDVAVADLSFISLLEVLPGITAFLKPGGLLACLIKPQFEVGSRRTERGVVRDEVLRRESVRRVEAFCRQELGFEHIGTVPSRILGPKGNQEYMGAFRKPPVAETD